MRRSLLALVGITVMSGAPASGQTATSAYTDLDTSRCPHTPGKEGADGGSWECPGLPGFSVRVAGFDARTRVSFGPPTSNDLAASQSFPSFNEVAPGKVEWRLRSGQPFATILRWRVSTQSDIDAVRPASSQVLVVTKLSGGGSCHVGYVFAGGNPDANAQARRLADDMTDRFRCGLYRPIVVGDVPDDLPLPR